jgi:hypothetical protein
MWVEAPPGVATRTLFPAEGADVPQNMSCVMDFLIPRWTYSYLQIAVSLAVAPNQRVN